MGATPTGRGSGYIYMFLIGLFADCRYSKNSEFLYQEEPTVGAPVFRVHRALGFRV